MAAPKERALVLAARIHALRGELAAAEAEFESLLAKDRGKAEPTIIEGAHRAAAVRAAVQAQTAGSLADRVVIAILSVPDRSWSAKAIAKAIGVGDYNDLRGTLPRLVKLGKIRKMGRGRFQAPVLPSVTQQDQKRQNVSLLSTA